MKKVYILEVKDADDGEEIKTFVFETLEDFNKARNIIHQWLNNIESLTIADFFKKHNINFLDYVYDEISI